MTRESALSNVIFLDMFSFIIQGKDKVLFSLNPLILYISYDFYWFAGLKGSLKLFAICSHTSYEVIRNLFPYVLWYADAQKCIIKNITIIYRSSLAEVFFKKIVLKNLSIFTEKHLCRSLFLNTVVGLGSLTLRKMRLRYSCFPVNSAKFLRASIFIKQLPGLLLYLYWDYILLILKKT